MSQRNLFTVQPFAQSKPKTVGQSDALSKLKVTTASRRSCCVPCKTEVVTVRPVLCSKQLQDTVSTTQRCTSILDSYNVGSYHNTPAGGAWVEHNPQECYEQGENWARAKRYNEEIENCSQEKACRLRDFQKEVKQRVKTIEKEKQQLLLARTKRDRELERNVARRTAFLAQASIPYASEVMVHGRSDRIIKTFPSQSTADAENRNPSVEAIAKITKANRSIDLERSTKKRARQRLNSKKLTNVVGNDLPGGCWRDTSYIEFHDYGDDMSTAGADLESHEHLQAEVDLAALQISEHESPLTEGNVQDTCRKKAKNERSLAYSMSGQEEEEIRKQKVKQRSLLRRLYMDIEREQVKEYKKMKAHLDGIAQIKRVKEEERERQELEAATECLPAADTSTAAASYARQVMEKERVLRQQKESNRYIKALRSLLKEKVDRLGIEMPPLCSCGSSIWDAHPDLCANNCPFYKNPKGYERAVQSLLASCEVLD